MGFFDFLNEIFDDEYKVITIKDGSNKYEIRAKLLYSFPRVKFFETKDQGFFAVGQIFVRGLNRQEGFLKANNLLDFKSNLGQLDIELGDFYKMIVELYGFDYFEKLSKSNSNEFISIGGVPKTIDHFYFSFTIPEFDDGYYISSILNANVYKTITLGEKSSLNGEPSGLYRSIDCFWINDGSYFFDGGAHLAGDGTILKKVDFFFDQYMHINFYKFLRDHNIKIKVPKIVNETRNLSYLKDFEDIFIFN